MIDYRPIPILFSMGPIQIYSIAFTLFLAFFIGFLITTTEVKRKRLEFEELKKISILVILGALIGARLYYLVENISYYTTDLLEIFKIWKGGVSSYGGFIGGFILPFIYMKKYKLDIWSYSDAFVPGICIGIVLCRIGCFLNWCCYGIASNLPWAVNVGDFPRHPTQIYLAMNGLILFFIFNRLKIKYRPAGELFLLFVVMYNVLRFLIEFLRDEVRYVFNLTGAQLLSFIILLVTLTYLGIRKFNEKS